MSRTLQSVLRIIAIVLWIFALSSSAQARQTGPTEGFKRGVSVLNSAVKAIGGRAALYGAKNIAFTLEGPISNGLQGYDPDKIDDPDVDGDYVSFVVHDYENDRYFNRTRQDLKGGFSLDFGAIYADGVMYSLANNSNTYTVSQGPAASPGAITTGTSRFLPALLLKTALDNFRSVRWVGETAINGKQADIVEFSWDESWRLQLYVMRGDHKVRRMRLTIIDSLIGDDDAVFDYVGDQTAGGLWHPARVVLKRRDTTLFNLAVHDLAVNGELQASVFEPPQGYAEVDSASVKTTEIADGLYEISGLAGGFYNTQFIEFADFIAVFEAPVGVPISNFAISQIRKTIPDKPIKYVVISHFHSDHAGGVGAYVDIGATVVTVKNNRSVIEAYARARPAYFGLTPAADINVKFQFVVDEWKIEDSTGKSATVYRLSPTPHVSDMLMLYDDASRAMIDGDLFSRIVKWNETFSLFLEWLQSDDSPEVDFILGTHHEKISKTNLIREYEQNSD